MQPLKTKHPFILLALLASALHLSCSGADMASASFVGDAFVNPPDMGDPNCPIHTPNGCIDTVAVACDFKARFGMDCSDADDDCFVANCSPSTPKWLVDALQDCNDQNADISPLLVERCNHIDDDCDRQVDEAFSVGTECSQCGQSGVLECAIDDHFGTACSVTQGQSAAVEATSEICNGIDEDCDQAIDEFCVIASDRPDMPQQLALCPNHILVVTAEKLTAIDENDVEITIVNSPGITHVRCTENWVVWLQATHPPCEVITEGPSRCTGKLWAWSFDGPPVQISSEDDYGPVYIEGDGAYWHTVNLDGPLVEHVTLGSAGPPTTVIGQASDPMGPVADDLLFVRRWDNGSAPQVGLQSISDENISRLVRNPIGVGGILVANDSYAVWSIGATQSGLWIVPRDNAARGGFQLPLEPGTYQPIAVVAEFLFYQEQSQPNGPVYRLDITTGQSMVFLEHAVSNSVRIALDGSRAIWLDSAWPNRFKVTSWPVPERRD